MTSRLTVFPPRCLEKEGRMISMKLSPAPRSLNGRPSLWQKPDCKWTIPVIKRSARRMIEKQSQSKPVNPFSPGDFAEKRVLKLVEWFSGHCRAIKSYHLPEPVYRSYTSRPSDPDAKYQLAKLLFAFSSPLFLRFSCLVFVLLLGI